MQPSKVPLIPPSPPSSPPTSSNETTPSSSRSNSSTSPTKNLNKGKRALKAHPPSQMMDKNFERTLTRSQLQEMDQVVSRLEKFQMYGDNEEEPKGKLVNYALFFEANLEPSYFVDVCTNDVWVGAMKEEIESFEKNDTWELVESPKGMKIVGSKWVYKTKFSNDGSIERYKTRHIAKGFTQTYSVDYEETFAFVARQETIWMALSLAANK